jgi:hypothetical protein
LPRQIAPRSAGTGPPEHRIEEHPVIHPPATPLGRTLRQHRRQQRPLGIGQVMTFAPMIYRNQTRRSRRHALAQICRSHPHILVGMAPYPPNIRSVIYNRRSA